MVESNGEKEDFIYLTKDEVQEKKIDSPKGILPDIEKKIIKFVIKQNKGDIGKASKILGISRTSIWRKLKEENLS